MIEEFRLDLEKVYAPELVQELLDSFTEVKENYYLGKHEPSELNGGKFVEACVRILQLEITGKYTPIGNKLPSVVDELRRFENSSKQIDDSLRLLIPRVLIGIYDIRSKRGVSHLGKINPNYADSTLIVTTASWVLAELYSIHSTIPISEAQKIVDDLVERKLALVHDLGDVKRVLDPSLTSKLQTLILLYSVYPNSLSVDELIESIEYSKPSVFKKQILGKLHKDRIIDYSIEEQTCTILPPGLKYVEDRYETWVNKFNERSL